MRMFDTKISLTAWPVRIALAVMLGWAGNAAAQHEHHATPEPGVTANSSLGAYDFFTNFGHYLARTHCMVKADGTPDWPWLIIGTLANIGVLIGYLLIFRFWRKSYFAEEPNDRNRKLMDLAWIFLLCACSGYLFPIVMLFWPAYRLQILFLIALTFVTWRFAYKINDLRVSFSVLRLQRELEFSLRNRATELEALVTQRTTELEAARQDAIAANQAKSRFVAHMSHEIRTPLTAMLGYANLLDDGSLAEPRKRECVDVVKQSGQHLLAIINDILDLSKIEAGRLDIVAAPTDVREVVAECVNLFVPRAAQRGNVINLTFDPAVPPAVMIDGMRLRQIVSNLLSNASKFTDDGAININVRYHHNNGSSSIEIAVVDTGIGMGPEQVQRLFQPFSQGDASMTRAYGGTGLGLAICRRLAEIMGGGITCRSELGRGSTFTMLLQAPAAQPAVVTTATTDSPAASAPPAIRAKPLTGRHVLLAEDHPRLRQLTQVCLEKGGASVVGAVNGQEVVDLLRSPAPDARPIDLVLLDMQMPVMDGYTAATELRALGYTGPIVAFTAHALDAERQRCLDAGCSHCVTKPFEVDDLLKQLAQAIADRPLAS